MTPIAILSAVLQFGPEIIPLIAEISKWIRDGKKDVSPEDIALLVSYGKKTSADYLADAGVAAPPPANHGV